MLQVDISVRDKVTFYLRIDMGRDELCRQINQSLVYGVTSTGFINIIDENYDIYMIRASEIKDITIHELSEGDDE